MLSWARNFVHTRSCVIISFCWWLLLLNTYDLSFTQFVWLSFAVLKSQLLKTIVYNVLSPRYFSCWEPGLLFKLSVSLLSDNRFTRCQIVQSLSHNLKSFWSENGFHGLQLPILNQDFRFNLLFCLFVFFNLFLCVHQNVINFLLVYCKRPLISVA